jgi:hypothetical protein
VLYSSTDIDGAAAAEREKEWKGKKKDVYEVPEKKS